MSRQISGYVPKRDGTGNYGRTLGLVNRHGIYNKENLLKVQKELKAIRFTQTESYFNIGDYGAADGAASMEFIKHLIVSLRELHGPQIEFQVIYEDQPTNDFNSLFANIFGTVPDDCSPLGELGQLGGVFPLASGIEFRKQCVPSDSMHFIFSTNSIHWMSEFPIKFTNSIHVNEDSPITTVSQMANQGQKDWATFLDMRGTELKKGGLLMITCPGYSNDDHFGKRYFQLLDDVWKAYRDEGKISETEFLDTNFSTVLYRPDDLKLTLEDENSHAFRSGLRLVSVELIIKDSVIYENWKKKCDEEGVDDVAGFARDYLAANWNFSCGTFLAGLSEERSEAEKLEILDKLYQDLEEEIKRIGPDEFKGDLVYSFVLIKKE